ncbi:MAG TPA: hypothetical protein VIL25_11960 [Vicinamibacterales bacterium]
MSDWAVVFLGVIALAVTVMAAIQVGIVVYGARLARRVDRLAEQLDREIKPLLSSLHSVGQEAARAASLATAQMERVDRLFADVAARVEETVAAIQTALITPAREGIAVLSGLRAAIATLKGMRRAAPASRHPHPDEDDALFIG